MRPTRSQSRLHSLINIRFGVAVLTRFENSQLKLVLQRIGPAYGDFYLYISHDFEYRVGGWPITKKLAILLHADGGFNIEGS